MTDQATILVVDDEANTRALLQWTLAQRGYQCLHAATGAEGIAATFNCAPSVILLDLGLPDLDGVEVTMRIRERCRTPIIIISASGGENDKIAALDAGANDYVTKPFVVGELLARVRVALRSLSSSEASPPTGPRRSATSTSISTVGVSWWRDERCDSAPSNTNCLPS
jgi:two-component system KDP operon response regulator KdpE